MYDMTIDTGVKPPQQKKIWPSTALRIALHILESEDTDAYVGLHDALIDEGIDPPAWLVDRLRTQT